MKEEHELSGKEEVIITNIQRMCMNDGPGIRTTVFFKGCNLRCPWCANPENISFEKEHYCKAAHLEGIYGTSYEGERLYKELIKDEEFWRSTGGGITFSGGEPLLHLHKVQSMLKRLKERDIHLSVETALHVPSEYLIQIMGWTDYFIVDIKILDRQNCKLVLHGNIDAYSENLGILKSNGKRMLFRIPCNMEYTATPENLERICGLLYEFPDIPVEIFGIHGMGKMKYESLGKTYREFSQVSEIQLEEIKRKLEQCTDASVVILHM